MGVLKGLAKMAVRTAVSSAAKGAAKQVLSGPSETAEQKKTFVRNGIRCIEDPYDYLHDGLECKLMSVNNNGRSIVGKGRVVNTGRGVFSNITVDVEYRLSNNEVIDTDYILFEKGRTLRPGEVASFSFTSSCSARNVDAVCVGISSYDG